MSRFIETFSSSLGKKYIMAASGLLLAGFILIHAAGNSSIFFGRRAFIIYAERLHSLGALIYLSEFVLLIAFLGHMVTGSILFLQNRHATGARRYAVSRPAASGRVTGSRFMLHTGLVILIFIIIHFFHFHSTGPDRSVADIATAVLSKPLTAALYATALAALTLHIGHGFWSLFQSLGVSHPAWDGLIRGSARIAQVCVTLIFAAIILLLLLKSDYLL